MSASLILLLLVSLTFSAIGVADPRRLLHYPVAAGLIMLAFIVPQAYAVERLHLADFFEPSISWLYFSSCLIMIMAGWALGRRQSASVGPSLSARERMEKYDYRRLAIACVVMAAIGAFAFSQIGTLAATGDYGSRWTGVITLYYLLSSLLPMALSISWLAYLMTGRRIFLIVAIVCFVVFIPILTMAVKRSWIFEIGVVLFGGLFFVKKFVPSRVVVLGAVLFGTVILHQVGNLRAYVDENQSTAIAAIADGALTENLQILEMDKAPEVQGAVTSIAISRLEGNYEPGVAIWNRLVHQYVPAFIVGRDAKEGLKFDTTLRERTEQEYSWRGATSTGFADSFSGFWWFGSLCFFLISYLFGRYWTVAMDGDLRARFLYLAILNDGLIAITESVARFVAALPFILGVAFVVFAFAAKPKRSRSGPKRTVERAPGSRPIEA